MVNEHFALLIGIVGVILAFLAAIAASASRKDERVSRPFRRDPMDWHPGRCFPPAMIGPDRVDERPTRAGQKVA